MGEYFLFTRGCPCIVDILIGMFNVLVELLECFGDSVAGCSLGWQTEQEMDFFSGIE